MRNVVVTGASRGIGAAVAVAFAAADTRVHVLARGDAEAVCAAVRERGGLAQAWCCDVSKAEEVAGTVADIEALGSIDVLINNAGIARDGLLLTLDTADWQATLDTNLTGAFLMSRAVLGGMLDQRRGVIINMSSPSTQRCAAGQTAYAASKAGLEGFTRALAVEMAKTGIRVNAVSPGRVDTDMTRKAAHALGALPGQPDDIAALVVFLASDAARYITGQVITADGGASVRR